MDRIELVNSFVHDCREECRRMGTVLHRIYESTKSGLNPDFIAMLAESYTQIRYANGRLMMLMQGNELLDNSLHIDSFREPSDRILVPEGGDGTIIIGIRSEVTRSFVLVNRLNHAIGYEPEDDVTTILMSIFDRLWGLNNQFYGIATDNGIDIADLNLEDQQEE